MSKPETPSENGAADDAAQRNPDEPAAADERAAGGDEKDATDDRVEWRDSAAAEETAATVDKDDAVAFDTGEPADDTPETADRDDPAGFDVPEPAEETPGMVDKAGQDAFDADAETDQKGADGRSESAASSDAKDRAAGEDESAPPIDELAADVAEVDVAVAAGGASAVVAGTESESLTGSQAVDAAESAEETQPPPPDEARPRRRLPWFGLFNLLLILLLAAAAGYYWWQQRQAAAEYRAEIDSLRGEIARRAESSRLEDSLQAVQGDIGTIESRLGELDTGQQALRESTVELFDLYARDKNDWYLAEVEYLMRVAQHQLILTRDFEGAAATLQAANDRLGELADPGMLPVRVTISEEIAALKTRRRPDLVGMTLILAQLARQVSVLRPGFEPLIEVDAAAADSTADSAAAGTPSEQAETGPVRQWMRRLSRYVDSLVEVRYEPETPPTLVEANVVDASETLADTLKLARWAVLERDSRQYQRLIDEAIRLTRSFYDLDHAANLDFINQLLELQKMQLDPEKPDITGSLRQLQRIITERKNAPAEATDG